MFDYVSPYDRTWILEMYLICLSYSVIQLLNLGTIVVFKSVDTNVSNNMRAIKYVSENDPLIIASVPAAIFALLAKPMCTEAPQRAVHF